jgi:hypothetical protein
MANNQQWTMPEMTQKNFRVLLPGKIAETVMLLSAQSGQDCFAVAKQFYDSPLYSELERESSKYWWLSPSQLETAYSTSSQTRQSMA